MRGPAILVFAFRAVSNLIWDEVSRPPVRTTCAKKILRVVPEHVTSIVYLEAKDCVGVQHYGVDLDEGATPLGEGLICHYANSFHPGTINHHEVKEIVECGALVRGDPSPLVSAELLLGFSERVGTQEGSDVPLA